MAPARSLLRQAKRQASLERIFEIATKWADENSITRLRATRKASLTKRKCAKFGLSPADAWDARNRAIALKRARRANDLALNLELQMQGAL